jgi:hypothetical protein
VAIFNFYLYAGLVPHARVAIIFYFAFGPVKDSRLALWQVEAMDCSQRRKSTFRILGSAPNATSGAAI